MSALPERLMAHVQLRGAGLIDLCRGRFCESDADAEDLFAEAVLRAWEHIENAEYSEHPGEGFVAWEGWFFRVIHNLAIDRHRVARRKARFADGLAGLLALGETVPGLQGDGRTPEERAIECEFVSELLSRAACLPERLARAMTLRIERGLSYAEIAQKLAISEAAARKRVQMGRAGLKRVARALTSPAVGSRA